MARLLGGARIQRGPELAADPFPYQIAPPRIVRSRRFRLFALAGLAAYAAVLIATIPARLLLERAEEPRIWLAASGTIWNGEAALGQGHAVRWQWAPMASLATLSFATHVQVIGAGTELEGLASARPGAVVIKELNGTASASLITALVPRLPFVCDFPMRVNLERLAFGSTQPGASGEILGSAGTCSSRSGVVLGSAVVPPLVAEATTNVGGSTGWLAPRGNRSERLVTFTVTPNGKTSVTVSPTASALIPGIEALRTIAD